MPSPGTAVAIYRTMASVEELTKRWESEGYKVGLKPIEKSFVDTHSHPFDAKICVTEGKMVITVEGGEPQTLVAGATRAVAAGTKHTEDVGDEGCTLLVGRREVPKSRL